MRREVRLLASCVSCSLGLGSLEELTGLLRKGVEATVLERLALRHRVLPLVFHSLSRALSAGAPVPAALIENLRGHHLRNLGRNVDGARLLARVVADLEAAGLTAVSYKGPVLAVSAFGDLGLRQFNDIDVFIKSDEIPPVFERLRALGFRPDSRPATRPPAGALRLLRDYAFRHEKSRLALEVQWRIAQRYHPVFSRPDELLERTVRISLEGASLRTFCAEDTLLILCLHGLYHSWSQLQMAADVAAVLGRLKPDGIRTLRLARAEGAERILFSGVLLARLLLGASPPAEVLAEARSDRPSVRLSEDIGRGFFDSRDQAVRARVFFFREARMFPSWPQRLRYVLGRLMTPNEEDLAEGTVGGAGAALLPLRRLVRLFRIYALNERQSGSGGKR